MKNLILNILRRTAKILAKATLRRYDPAVIGITGNVGKTSTKEAVAAVVGSARSVRAPAKNFNNELGLPLTILGNFLKTGGLAFWLKVFSGAIWRLLKTDSKYPEVLVLEYGVDHPGDMRYLTEIARPHIGVFSAFAEIPVHVEFFSSPEAMLREKSKLLEVLPATGFAILNADDKQVFALKSLTRARPVSFGFSDKADFRISNFLNNLEAAGDGGVSFKISNQNRMVPVKIPGSFGRGQAYAAAAAAAVGSLVGLNLVQIAENLAAHYKPAPGRARILKGIKDSTLIDDTYNSSPAALKEALETLKDLPAKRRIAVLGDMLELGTSTMEAHEAAGRQAAKACEILIAIGLRAKMMTEAAIKAGLPKRSVFYFNNLREAGAFLQDKIGRGDVVLFKASQGVRLEKIVKEVMAEPQLAPNLLPRQNSEWLAKQGLYD